MLKTHTAYTIRLYSTVYIYICECNSYILADFYIRSMNQQFLHIITCMCLINKCDVYRQAPICTCTCQYTHAVVIHMITVFVIIKAPEKKRIPNPVLKLER